MRRTRRVLSSSRRFTTPSRAESFGSVYVEALLLGTTIIRSYENAKELEELLNVYIGENSPAM